jgi:hypothetical protein
MLLWLDVENRGREYLMSVPKIIGGNVQFFSVGLQCHAIPRMHTYLFESHKQWMFYKQKMLLKCRLV